MNSEEKKHTQLEWKPGVEINSEAEYIAMSNLLAKDLLNDNTPEQLALITAQHLIYVDQLSRTNMAVKKAANAHEKIIQQQEKKSDALIKKLDSSITNDEAAMIYWSMIQAYKKNNALKGANARHKKSTELKIKLMAEWEALHDKDGQLDKKYGYSSRADFSRIISSREGMKERTLYNWITEHERSKKA